MTPPRRTSGRGSTAADRTLLLYPGAGSNRDQPGLRAIEAAVEPGWTTIRADFDYRRQGRRAPDRAPKLLAAVRRELEGVSTPVVLGGRSMGGRMATMIAAGADDIPPPPDLIGVVSISYPLHPPGRPDMLRVAHLAAIRVPCLFVSGTRDAFGTPDELMAWTSTIPGPVTHRWVEGKGHDLRGADAEVAGVVSDWLHS